MRHILGGAVDVSARERIPVRKKCVACWHPRFGMTLAGADVATWVDIVGGYTLAPITVGPTYGATAFNGGGGVAFDDSNTMKLGCTDAALMAYLNGTDKPWTIVAMVNRTDGFGEYVLGFGDADAAATHCVYLRVQNTTTTYSKRDAGAAVTMTGTAPAVGAVGSVGIVDTGTAGTIYSSGAAAGGPTAVDTGAITVSRLVVGSSDYLDGGDRWVGAFGGLWISNQALSAAEVRTVHYGMLGLTYP